MTIEGFRALPFRFGGLGIAPTVAHSDIVTSSLAGPGVASTAAHSDILTAAGALLLGQTYASELWVPAKDFDAGLGTPTYPFFGGWAAGAFGWQFPDAVGAYGIIGHTQLPADYVAGTTVTLDLYYQGGGAGNFMLSMQASARSPGTPGDDMRYTGGSATNTVIASQNGLALQLAACTVGDTPAANDLINIAIARDSNNAADTSANVMVVFGVRGRYTAVRV